MELFAQQAAPARCWAVMAGLFAASMVLWWKLFGHWARGRRVPPYEPRRRFPWEDIDVAIVMFWWFIGAAVVFALAARFLQISLDEAAADSTAGPETAHPVARLLESQNPGFVFLALLTAVVIAPVAEECVFRLILQGWIERRWRRLRRVLPAAVRVAPGVLSILLVSLVFASIHGRGSRPAEPAEKIAVQLALQGATSVVTLLLLVGLARLHGPLSLEALGIAPGKLAGDVKLGLGAWLLVTPPVYFVFWACALVAPRHVVTDPIPLFLLALVLGLLYFRTHRIVAAIVTHMAFNATAMILAFLAM